MKKSFTTFFLIASAYVMLHAQAITLPPSGDNQKSSVTQWIGPVCVTITYSSPNVTGPNGEDRKGHIWGELVPYGFTDLGFGTSKAAPWRAGANLNTTITLSHDVKVQGKELKAGTYGLHLDVQKEGPWNLIFSNNSTSWGSFFYKPEEDALRTPVSPADHPHTEYLTYGFEEREPARTTAYLAWESKKIPFTIEVPNITEIYLSEIRKELRSSPGFNYQNWMSASQFCVNNKVNLDEALLWADNSISLPFIGNENFNTLSTKANVLTALGREAEAKGIMDKAINHPTASVGDVHQYGRRLLAAGKKEEAMTIFQTNRKMHPDDTFTTYVGLARGYSALGDKKNSIKYWDLAIKNLPENQKGNLAFYESELKKVKEGS